MRWFSRLSGWEKFWLALLSIGGLGEAIALIRKRRGDTFSELLWKFRQKTRGEGVYSLILFLLAWLILHLWQEGRRTHEQVEAIAKEVGAEDTDGR